MALPIVIAASAATALVSQYLWQSAQDPPAWGVYDDQGNAALDPDSVLEFTYRREFEIANFPIQQGAFASYNKVIKPFEIQMRFSKGGTQTDRETLLSDLEDLVQSLDMYTVITPEGTYPNCNPQRYEVTRRGAGGAFFLTEVDLFLVQIVEVTAQYTNTTLNTSNAQNPAAQDTSNVGSVQPGAPSTALMGTGTSALNATPEQFY